MKLFKQPWFIILVLVASIYSYQYYKSPKKFSISSNTASATTNTDEDALPQAVSVKTSSSFTTSQFNSFELATYRNMKIKFSKSDSEKFIVSLIGEGTDFKNDGKELTDWFKVSIKRKTLQILSPKKNKLKGFSSMKELAKTFNRKNDDTQLTMIIEVPETFKFKKLNIKSVSSDVYGSGLNFDEFEMANVSGDISLAKSTGKKVKIESVSGDSEIEVGDLESAQFSFVSGDATLTATNTTPKVKFESVSGDLDLKLPSDGKIKVNFESMSGDLINDFGLAKDNATAVEFSSLSGDASIKKNK